MLPRSRPILPEHLTNKIKGDLYTLSSSTIFLCDHTQLSMRYLKQEVFCICAVKFWSRIFWMAYVSIAVE